MMREGGREEGRGKEEREKSGNMGSGWSGGGRQIYTIMHTFLDIPGHLVASGADTEPTLWADPVEVEESSVTCVTHLPQSLHCSLPDWGH